MTFNTDESAASVEGTVTRWICRLQAGDQAAVEPLWSEYFPRLVALARKTLRFHPSRCFDEEDAALSAFATFWRRFSAGEFLGVRDRDSLWRLLGTITIRKLRRYQAEESAEKRGGHWNRAYLDNGWDAIGALPTADLDREAEALLESLVDETLVRIATLRLMGYNVEEVGTELGLSRRTVERKLQVIRTVWREVLQE